MGVRPTFLISAVFAAGCGLLAAAEHKSLKIHFRPAAQPALNSGGDVRALGQPCPCPLYGDVYPQSGGDCKVDLFDILCVLDGSANIALCPGADVAPCGGDGTIDVEDVAAVLDAFAGSFSCPHPTCSPPTVSITAPAASSILSGVVENQKTVDPIIRQALTEDWPLSRLDSTLRAILRAGVFELMERKDVPVAVILSEYVDIAKAFYVEEEPKLVNAVLDRVARRVRGEGRGRDAP